jgi:hypothetical protein
MPQYTALSYVWGRVETLLCKKANLVDLEVAGSLDTAPFSSTLATTISDAMTLTKSLGLRYLWADMLCIVQDDPSDKMVRLPNMANIYGDAHFTIVATDGTHTQSGMLGVSRSSPRTSITPLLRFNTPSLTMSYAMKPSAEENREKIWHTRAWTMQERALSRRTLMFLDQTVSWTCTQASFDEETFVPTSPDDEDDVKACYYCQSSSVSDTSFVKPTTWPHLDNYSELASLFTERFMTCANDMLNAFAGILATFEPSFPYCFTQGLPEFFFDVALLWRRFESKPSRRARKPFRRCLEPGKMWAFTRSASWSWAGWEDCRVQWPLLYNDAVDWDMQVIPISPVTSWLKVSEHNTLSAVHNDYHQYRTSVQEDPNHPKLLEGWSRHAQTTHSFPPILAPSGPRHEIQIPAPHIQPHPSPPNHRSPLHPPQIQQHTLHIHLPLFLLLSLPSRLPLHAQQRMGRPHARYPNSRPTSRSRAHGLRGRRHKHWGRECGARRFEWEVERVEEIVPEVKHFKQIREAGGVYRIYNVMWLAWEEGIAYRRGIGRVWGPVWERQELRRVDVMLG